METPMSKAAQRILKDRQAERAGTQSPAPPPVPTGPNKFASVTRGRDMGDVLLSEIVPDEDQVRQTFDEGEIQRLTASVGAKGILTALRVRWRADLGKWQTVLGGKRLEAAKRVGLTKVPCKLVDGEMTRADCLEEQIAENEQRSAPPPMETAAAWQELMTLRDWTQDQFAAQMHLSQSRVSKTLKLLKLPEALQAEVRAGTMPADVAVEIGKIKDPAEQEIIHRETVSEGMTRDEVAKKVKKQNRKGHKRKPAPKEFATATFHTEDCVWKFFAPSKVTDEDVYRLYRLLGEQIGANRQGRAA